LPLTKSVNGAHHERAFFVSLDARVHQGTVEKMPRLPCLIDQDMRTEFSLQGHVCQAAWRFVSIMTSTRPCAGQGTLTQHRVRPCADSFLHLDNRVWRKKIFIFINSTLLFSFYPILVCRSDHMSCKHGHQSWHHVMINVHQHHSVAPSSAWLGTYIAPRSSYLNSTNDSMTRQHCRQVLRNSIPIDGPTQARFYLYCWPWLEASASSPQYYRTFHRTS
jgi:hypothetical protein